MAVQTTACLDLELQTLGKVKGDSTTTSLGRKNLIEVLAYHHDVAVQRDSPPGTNVAQHVEKPIRWSTPVGTASVALFQGLLANDTIVKAVFRFFNHNRAGKEQEYYRVTLEDGGIDSMSTRLPHAKGTDPADRDEYHELEFSYRKITVENLIAGHTATDDSLSPRK
jgi:type VI secretion system Hcp family effector